jgi:hypothetical protein
MQNFRFSKQSACFTLCDQSLTEDTAPGQTDPSQDRFIRGIIKRKVGQLMGLTGRTLRDRRFLEPRYRDFGMEVPSLTVEQFWTQVTDFGIDEVDLIKLAWEGAEYLIISELSARGLMDRIGVIRGEWHSRKDKLPIANLLGQTHDFNIDPNYPHSVG